MQTLCQTRDGPRIYRIPSVGWERPSSPMGSTMMSCWMTNEMAPSAWVHVSAESPWSSIMQGPWWLSRQGMEILCKHDRLLTSRPVSAWIHDPDIITLIRRDGMLHRLRDPSSIPRSWNSGIIGMLRSRIRIQHPDGTWMPGTWFDHLIMCDKKNSDHHPRWPMSWNSLNDRHGHQIRMAQERCHRWRGCSP
jgi:hypothetical protein